MCCSSRESARSPGACARHVSVENGFVEVKFKPLAGKEDQAGGAGVALEGRRQLLRRTRQCAREQRLALLHRRAAAATRIKYVDAPVPPNIWHTLRVEFAGQAHPRRAERQAYIDVEDSHIEGAGAVGAVDQGRQRHGVRRLQLRLGEVIRLVLAARALRAFADGFIAVVLPAYLLALGIGTLEVGFLSTATLLGSAPRRSPSAAGDTASPSGACCSRQRC